MDEYDEFGNYIGDAKEEEEEEDVGDQPGNGAFSDDEDEDMFGGGDGSARRLQDGSVATSSAIVLHEDKNIYPSAQSVFGDDVEIVTEEDSGPTIKANKPLLPREEIVREKKRKHTSKSPEDAFDDFVMSSPALVRIVAFVGHIHSGKSSLVRFLHRKAKDTDAKTSRTVNVRDDERAMKITIKTRAVSSTCSDSNGKSYFLQTLDCPGHVNFLDEMECALELADGAVLAVDVVEGVQLGTELAVSSLSRHGLLDSTVVCFTKMDRLIHELKLPPSDAYRKLAFIADQLEDLFDKFGSRRRLDFEGGQVLFSSAEHGFCFSLASMARLASPPSKSPPDEDDVAKLTSMLWGDVYYDPNSRRFSPRRTSNDEKRAFEHFCLEPLYKIYSHVLGSEPADVVNQLEGLSLSKKDQTKDALPLLKTCLAKALRNFHGPYTVLVDSIRSLVQSSNDFCAERLSNSYWNGGELMTEMGKRVIQASATGPLLLHGTKLVFPQDDSEDVLDEEELSAQSFNSEVSFRVLARVFSGTIRTGDEVYVLEPKLMMSGADDGAVELRKQHMDDMGDDEDVGEKIRVRSLRLPSRGGGSSCRPVESAGPGTLVLICGIDSLVSKSATISTLGKMPRFPPLRFLRTLSKANPVCKLAMEPLIPSELPKMLSGLRAVQRSYPSSRVEVEESGEYVLMGTGELYLDSIMRDLRERFAKGTEIKVVDPFVMLNETVSAASTRRTLTETPNGKNEFSFVAEPLEKRLVEDLERGYVQKQVTEEKRSLERLLKTEYDYDILASRSVWAFGPNPFSPNALLDDTLPPNKPERLNDVREALVEGFRWGTREGPLCGEQVRGVKLKLLSANIALEERERLPGQIIKTMKRACHETILHSTPSLFEPIYNVDGLISESRSINLVKNAFAARRGEIKEILPVPGTSLHRFKGFIPVLDSFGLETEIRLRSRGSVLPQMYFEGWALVPGDPLDDSIVLKPLEPSPPDFLARDLVVKTRRRKGLPELIEQSKTLDPTILMRELNSGQQ